MKTVLKTLISAAVFVATASTAFAEEYIVTSVVGTPSIKVTLQGGGSVTVNDKSAAKAGLTDSLKQTLNLHPDHTMTGSLGTVTGATLFSLSGSWYRPTGSKVIYFSLDGDPSKGQASDGAWGALFDPNKAAIMALNQFMPVLFINKVSSVEPIYPSVSLKTGLIKLKLAGDTITGATTELTIAGRAMTEFCKMDKAQPPQCSISKGPAKDIGFAFTAKTKSTVEVVAP